MKSSLFTLALATSVSASFFHKEAAIFKRDAATIENDIANISTQVQSLTTAINAFQTFADAGALIAAEMNLEAAINKGTADTMATTALSESDGTTILNAVNALIPLIVDALNAATNKAPVFTPIGVEPLVITDLMNLQTETDAFANALIAIAPADLITAANAAKSCIDAGFAAALAMPPTQASASCAAPPISVSPTSVPPTSVPPTSVPPTSVPPTSTFPTTTAPNNGTGFPTTTVSKNGTSTFPTTSVSKNGTTTTPPTTVPPGSTCPPGGSGPGTTTVTTTSISVSVTTSVSTSVSTVTVTGGGGTTTTCPSNSQCTKAANVYEIMANADNILANWVCSF